MNKKILALILVSFILIRCSSEDSSPATNISAVGQQVRVTPSPFQNIDFFFEFEFLEEFQASVNILDKNDTSNQLDQQTIDYGQEDNILNFEVIYNGDAFNFTGTLNAAITSYDLVRVDVTLNGEDINSTYTELPE